MEGGHRIARVGRCGSDVPNALVLRARREKEKNTKGLRKEGDMIKNS